MKLKWFFMALVMAFSGIWTLNIATAQNSGQQVVAYYFHGQARCVTCTNMQIYSQEAIETRFTDAVASGKLRFQSVDVDQPQNKHFVENYQLYSQTLILSLIKDGQEIKFKNLEKIWQLSRNKDKFSDYVTDEIQQLMNELESWN